MADWDGDACPDCGALVSLVEDRAEHGAHCVARRLSRSSSQQSPIARPFLVDGAYGKQPLPRNYTLYDAVYVVSFFLSHLIMVFAAPPPHGAK